MSCRARHGNTKTCHAMPAMPCHAMPCHAIPVHATQYNATQCTARRCPAVPCCAMLCNTRLCYAIASLVLELDAIHAETMFRVIETVLFPPSPERLVFPSAITGRRVLDAIPSLVLRLSSAAPSCAHGVRSAPIFQPPSTLR